MLNSKGSLTGSPDISPGLSVCYSGQEVTCLFTFVYIDFVLSCVVDKEPLAFTILEVQLSAILVGANKDCTFLFGTDTRNMLICFHFLSHSRVFTLHVKSNVSCSY